MSLLENLLVVSEKAANIARLCRQNRHLFELLIQEKKPEESNPRFVEDFKTLADVLIQETVKNDVGSKFPEIKKFIFGEENNVFENKLGESITVEILESAEKTTALLRKVLNDDEEAAALLAEVVHEEISFTDVCSGAQLPLIEDCDDLAIWIDPIDSTAEYINGVEKRNPMDIFVSGLSCVTVLLGVFNRRTGQPVMGIVNQPFFRRENEKWIGRHFWSYIHENSIENIPVVTRRICLSSTEDEGIKSKLKWSGFELIEAAGAGYKCLLVILGKVDAYILSKSSTYKWDTCAPQALLASMNGGLVKYEEAIDGKIIPVSYKVADHTENKLEECCNKGGIIAYNNKCILDEILLVLKG